MTTVGELKKFLNRFHDDMRVSCDGPDMEITYSIPDDLIIFRKVDTVQKFLIPGNRWDSK